MRIRAFLTIFLLLAIGITGCISDQPGVDAPSDIIHYPIGVAVHPAGRYAAVVNANFNQAYKNGSVVVIDLSTYSIVSDWTMPIGSFGGEVAFNHAGTRLYVTARGPFMEQDDFPDLPADVLMAIDVDPEVASAPPADKPFFLRETRASIQLAEDPFGIAVDANDRYIYVSHITDGEMSIIEDEIARFTDETNRQSAEDGSLIRRCVPENLQCPSTVASSELCGPCEANSDCGQQEVVFCADDGRGGISEKLDNLCLTNPRSPERNFCATACEVNRTQILEDEETGECIQRLGCEEGYRCEIIAPLHLVTERKFSRGGNQVAISPLSGTVYVTHRDANVLGVLRPSYIEGIGFQAQTEQLNVGDGYDLRGLGFSSDGSKLFVASRGVRESETEVPSILILDTELTFNECEPEQYVNGGNSCEKNDILDVIEMAQEPANLVVHGDTLYVAAFGNDELYVIDILSRQVIEVIDLAPEAFIEEPGIFREHARPYDLTTYETEAGLFALVSNFMAHEIAVVHLLDQHGNFINRVVRKIENRAKLYEQDQF